MSQQIINIGTSAGAGDGDDLRVAFDKVNTNFTEIYSGNVVAGNVVVYSVAGRVGNVVLSVQDVLGAASYSNIANVMSTITVANAAARAYTDNAIANLGPLANVDITGGNISGVYISDSYAILTNLTVSTSGVITGQLSVGENLGVDQNIAVGGYIAFDDGTTQSTAWQGFGNIFTVAAASTAAISSLQANLIAANSAITTNTNRVAAANTAIAALTTTISTQATNDAANVAAANASIISTNNKIGAANVAIDGLRSNVTAANAQIVITNANVAAANAAIAALSATVDLLDPTSVNANVAAANAAILVNTARVSAANLAIAGLRANITAANVIINTLTSDVSDVAADTITNTTNIGLINANVAAANAAILSSVNRSTAANIEIGKLQANIAAANVEISNINANVAAANAAIAALGEPVDADSINANVAAANAAIVVSYNKISAANVEIGKLRANITAANTAILSNAADIATLQTDVVTAQETADAAQAGLDVSNVAITNASSRITANQLSVNANVNATNANVTAANAAISGLRANITAANVNISTLTSDVATLTANAATQSAQINVLTSNAATQATAIAARAALTGAAFTGNISTTGNLAVTGNVSAGNVSGTKGTFTTVAGTLLTAAQPNITSVGTLTGLTTDGNIQGRYITATVGFDGPLLDGIQLNITRVGLLENLEVETSIEAGTISANSMVIANDISANTVTALTVTGTLVTAEQPAITDVGLLTNVRVADTAVIGGNIFLSGSIFSNVATNRVQVGTVVANVGNLSSINATIANVSTLNAGAITLTGDLSVANLTATGDVTITGDVSAANVTGTLLTAEQPNITEVGTLGNLDVTGEVTVGGNTAVTGNVSGSYFIGNVVATNVTIADTLVTGNIDAGYVIGVLQTSFQPAITTVGNLVALNVDTDLTVSGNLILTSAFADISAGVGSFVDLIGNVKTNAQPYINSLGTLTGLEVVGEASVTGNAYVSNDMFVNGNLYVAGNNTVVNAEIVTTQEKNVVLANGVVSSTLAAGAGIFVGNDTGVYGNLTIHEGTWITPNNFNIKGNLTTANVTAGNLSTTGVEAVTIRTSGAANFDSASITGNVSAGNVGATQGSYNTVVANLVSTAYLTVGTSGTIADLVVTNTANVGTLAFADGTTQTTNAVVALGDTVAGINANVSAANAAIGVLDANLGTATTNISTLDANLGTATTNITSLQGNITAANVEIDNLRSNITAANLEISSLQSNITAANLEIGSLQSNVAAANVVIGQNSSDIANIFVTLGGLAVNTDPTFGGTLSADNLRAFANVYSGAGTFGTGNISLYSNAGVGTISTTSSNLVIETTGVGYVVIEDSLDVRGNLTAGNVAGASGVFTNVEGTLVTVAQPNITTVGTLVSLAVDGNVTTGNVSGTSGVFTNVEGTLVTATQPNITTVGNLTDLNVDGNVQSNTLTVASTVTFQSALTLDVGLTVNADAGFTNIDASGNISADGDLIALGTASVVGNVTVGNLIANTQVVAPTAVIGSTVINANIHTSYLTVDNNLTSANAGIGNAQIVTAVVSSTNNSTSTSTGALVVDGGAGIAKSVYIGQSANVAANVNTGNLNVTSQSTLNGPVYIEYPLVETSLASIGLFNEYAQTIIMGAEADNIQLGQVPSGGPAGGGNVYVMNGLNVTGNLYANANTHIKSTTQSTSVSTGALIVSGGAGIASNVNIGGNLTVAAKSYTTGVAEFASNVDFAANTNTVGNVYANNFICAYNLYANAIIINEGSSIEIPALNNTPIGQEVPAAGGFTELKFDTLVPRYPRPAERPTLMLDFANNPYIDPRLVFSRGSSATYTDYTGNLVIAGVDEIRYHHAGNTIQPRGILLEEATTNLYTHSNDFANTTGWDTLDGTVTTTVNTTAPSGVLGEAYELVEGSGSGLHGIYTAVTNQPTLTSTAYYTASVYAKAGTRTQISIAFFGEAAGPIFDFQTGSVYLDGASYASQMENFGNGWFRCSATVQKTNTSGNIAILVADGGVTTLSGTSTVGAYVYGFQVEAKRFPTSYVPTEFASASRSADSLEMPDISTWYKGQEGAFFVEGQIGYEPTALLQNQTRPTFVSLEDGTAATRISLLAETLTAPVPYRAGNLVVYSGGTSIANVGTMTSYFTSAMTNKIAAYFKANSFAVATNGNTMVGTQTTGIMPTGFTTLKIGAGTASNPINGTISKIMYYPRKPAGGTTEIVGLTAQ